MPSTHDIIVIGGGHNGLTAACYLARQGLDVVVVEASSGIGGMTATSAVVPAAPYHRFNTGAVDLTFLRATNVVAELGLRSAGFADVEVDPGVVYLGGEGHSLCFWRDPRRTAEEIRALSAPDAEQFLHLARLLDGVYDVAVPLMSTNPTRPDPRALARAGMGAVRHRGLLRNALALFVTPLAQIIDERFTHALVRDALAALCATGAPITKDGSGLPLLFLAFIHRVGISRPIGGMQALPAALLRVLEAAGGTARVASPVESVLVSGGHTVGVRLADGEEIGATKGVVATSDPMTTLLRLVPEGTLDRVTEARAAHLPVNAEGGGWVKVDIALSGRLRLDRHQRRRSDDVDLRLPAGVMGGFDDSLAAWTAATQGRIPIRPIMYTVVPTGVDGTQAPEGQDTLYLWASPMPAQPLEPWSCLAEQAARAMVERAAESYDGIADLEVGRSVETPVDAAQRLRVTGGSLFHVDATPLRIGPLRPAIGLAGYRTPLPGLYLGGAGSHPGAGVSGLPGRLAARQVLRDVRTGRREGHSASRRKDVS